MYTSHGWKIPGTPDEVGNKVAPAIKACPGPQSGGCEMCDDEIWLATSAMTMRSALKYQSKALKATHDYIDKYFASSIRPLMDFPHYELEVVEFSYMMGNWRCVITTTLEHPALPRGLTFEFAYDRDKGINYVEVRSIFQSYSFND